MSVAVNKISLEEWKRVSENAHKVVFNEKRSAEMDRIDFALLAVHEDGTPWGYVTVREFSQKVVYWQYGGMFPSIRGTIYSAKCHEEFLKWHKDAGYEQIIALVESENVVYLKMAMHFGFRINGVRMYEGEVLVELLNDLRKEK